MSAFSTRVLLGRTGLTVSRIGVGSAYGVSERACRNAFDQGLNYFFWGSVRTAGMGAALREIGRGPDRDDLVVVLECYVRQPRLIPRSVERGLRALGLDRVDVLLLGWYDRQPAPRVLDAVSRLREKGLYRFLGISSHVRPLFQRYLEAGAYDLFHVRYNAAHRGAEREVFPFLPAEASPGVVSFTNTRWGDLLDPRKMPPGTPPLSAADCYRFALSNPHVHVAICGPKSDEEMVEGLSVLRSGPLDDAEMERARRIGDHVHGVSSFMSFFT